MSCVDNSFGITPRDQFLTNQKVNQISSLNELTACKLNALVGNITDLTVDNINVLNPDPDIWELSNDPISATALVNLNPLFPISTADRSIVVPGTSLNGSGSRFMFDFVNSSIRAGSINATQWDDANRGSHSVGFGENNITSGAQSTVAGGLTNIASNLQTFVGAGETCTASGSRSCVVGGLTNTASGTFGFVGGGQNNVASAFATTIGGGQNNLASALNASITGGTNNTASGVGSHVGGGSVNAASTVNSTISGGATNTASGSTSTVCGGEANIASGDHSVVSGGQSNTAGSLNSGIFAGTTGSVSFSSNSVVIGGSGNSITNGGFSAILGGNTNSMVGGSSNAVILGGSGLTSVNVSDTNTAISQHIRQTGGLRTTSFTSVNVVGPTALADTEYLIICNTSAAVGNVGLTLPTTPQNGVTFIIKDIGNTANLVTLTAGGADMIVPIGGANAASITLLNGAVTTNDARTVVYHSTPGLWYVLF